MRLLPLVASTEFIQEEESAREHNERNPEMNVGSDGAEQAARSGLGRAVRHFTLEKRIQPCAENLRGLHLRD